MNTNSNHRFHTYVAKYCEKHGTSRKEALSHKVVQIVKEQYEQEEREHEAHV